VTLVDTNVLLDLITDDPRWADWSQSRLEQAVVAGPVFANDVVYSELSTRFTRIEDLDQVLEEVSIEIARTPRRALFLAGKAFLQYRRSGGVRTGVLSDFFIGAHAALDGMVAVDARRATLPQLLSQCPPDYTGCLTIRRCEPSQAPQVRRLDGCALPGDREGEESPGSTETRCRLTTGGGDPRESATENKPPRWPAFGRQTSRQG
jgi:predicted nucleic acid-binding protein